MKLKLLKEKLKNRVKPLVAQALPSAMPQLMPELMQFAHHIPHRSEANSYVLPAYPAPTDFDPISGLPVPPSDLWAYYGSSAEEYLESGRQDVEKMRKIVEQSGAPIEKEERILEFGCAAGRMIRWFADLAPTREIWGVDIWTSAILWCKEHLGESLYFATTTIAPHLPFEDRYFGFAYAGSIFTHIEDLTDAWFLELRRILRPGGKLYFSINDRRAVAVFEGQRTEEEFERYYKRVGGRQNWDYFVNWLRERPEYQRFKNGDANMVTINRSMASHVLWDAQFLCKRLGRFWRVLSINEKAYGHQTTVLLQKI